MNPLQSVKPEDKNKVIALSAAITVMFGYAGVNAVRTLAAQNAPAPTPSPTPGSSSASPASGAVAGDTSIEATARATEAEAKAKAARHRIVLPDLSADPFSPVAGNKDKSDRAPSARINEVIPSPTPSPTPLPKPAFKRPVPPAAPPLAPPVLPFVAPGLSGTAAGRGSVLPAPVPEIPMALAGVIRGEVNAKGAEIGAVAMIEAGEGQQFVRLWDTVEGWRLIKIGGESVTLRRGKQIRVLRVGAGDSSAVMGASAPAPVPAPAPSAVPIPAPIPASAPVAPSAAAPPMFAAPVAPAAALPTVAVPASAPTTLPAVAPQDTPVAPAVPATPAAAMNPPAPPPKTVAEAQREWLERLAQSGWTSGRSWLEPLPVSEFWDTAAPLVSVLPPRKEEVAPTVAAR